MDYLVRLAETQAASDGLIWVDALEPKTYHTAQFGKIPVTTDTLNKFVSNFKENVRGQEIPLNYEHGRDPAKGTKAAGWFRDMAVKDGRLKVAVELTEPAKQEVNNKEWKYFSLEWDNWTDNSGKAHKDVVLGGALTNRPVAKGLGSLPVNFSEVLTKEEAAPLLIEAVNPEELMEPGTNAPDLTPDDDGWDKGWRRETPPPGFDGSIKDQPSTVTEALVGLLDSDTNVDPDLEKWIREVVMDKKNENGGDKMDDKLKEELRKLYGLNEDADDATIVKHASDQHTKFSELTAAASDLSGRKAFSEQYPEEHKRMVELENSNRDQAARLFSEGLVSRRVTHNEGEGDTAKKVPTKLGFSGGVVELAKETHKKFSEGVATLEDFIAFSEAVLDSGIVDYGEAGTTLDGSTVDDSGEKGSAAPTNVTSIRTAFAEKVDKVREKNAEKNEGKGIEFAEAIAIAAAEDPKLYDAYRTANPVAS